jgi:hypothetical protein
MVSPLGYSLIFAFGLTNRLTSQIEASLSTSNMSHVEKTGGGDSPLAIECKPNNIAKISTIAGPDFKRALFGILLNP